jgi:small subunit ribosomal protein S4
MRLDNIVYRLGFASTIPGARQLVNHGHVLVNGKKVDIPSFQCNSNDTVIIRSKKLSQDLAKKSIDLVDSRQIPNYLELDKEGLKGKVLSIINREDVGINVNELLIVEFYSRK